jgi:hypothetical protein
LDPHIRGHSVARDPGLVEQPQHEQQRGPEARSEYHATIAARELEGAALATREQ